MGSNALQLVVLNADYFILSAMPDPFAIAGLNDALRDIMDAKDRGNSKLVLLGVVISAVDTRTSLANSLADFVEQSFRIGKSKDSIKFKATIGRSTVIPQTQKVGKTLFETHSTHKITDQYRELAMASSSFLGLLGSLLFSVVTTGKNRNAVAEPCLLIHGRPSVRERLSNKRLPSVSGGRIGTAN